MPAKKVGNTSRIFVMKTMEKKASVKTPTYALVHGTGLFVAFGWICSKCGRTVLSSQKHKPPVKDGGPCPATFTGNHLWIPN